MKNHHITFLRAVAFLIVISSFCINTGMSKENSSRDSILVGVEYFNGWWQQSPNKWEYKDKDWRSQYPGRIPLLGQYNNQKTMNKEILAASDYGVGFFSFLWYYPGNVKANNNCSKLNAGLDFFMKSPYANRMKFMMELCNHKPFTIETDQDWEKCADVAINAMKHPSYLRVDNRAVLKIHSGYQFYRDCGENVPKCKQILQMFRQKARDAGVGELLIALGTYREQKIGAAHFFSTIGEVDVTMQYMSSPVASELPQTEEDYPYEDLLAWAQKIRDIRRNDILNWVPYFPAGWNPRPWRVDRACYSFPTREEWKTGLEVLKRELLKTTNFGFPRKDGTTQKAFTIYAWNEFGEGGILAPTKGDKSMKLEVVKEVFKN